MNWELIPCCYIVGERSTSKKAKQDPPVNLLKRRFHHEQSAKACVSDITYIPGLDEFLYLTVVLGLFDRKLIGWSICDSMSASSTVIPAIRMAKRNRIFNQGMIFHSDRGVQYASKHTVNVLESLKACQSKSRKGNCWDNVVAEDF